MYGCVVVYVCIYVNVCLYLFAFLIVYMNIKKCVLKRIHKVIGHHMYIIDILVCGTYFRVIFCAGVSVSVCVILCVCFMWILCLYVSLKKINIVQI